MIMSFIWKINCEPIKINNFSGGNNDVSKWLVVVFADILISTLCTELTQSSFVTLPERGIMSLQGTEHKCISQNYPSEGVKLSLAALIKGVSL